MVVNEYHRHSHLAAFVYHFLALYRVFGHVYVFVGHVVGCEKFLGHVAISAVAGGINDDFFHAGFFLFIAKLAYSSIQFTGFCGYGLVVECDLPKVETRVQFPVPAPLKSLRFCYTHRRPMGDLDDKKIDRILELTETNNKMLRSMKRAIWTGRIMSIVYWALLIGISIGALWFLRPYLEQVEHMVEQIRSSSLLR